MSSGASKGWRWKTGAEDSQTTRRRDSPSCKKHPWERRDRPRNHRILKRGGPNATDRSRHVRFRRALPFVETYHVAAGGLLRPQSRDQAFECATRFLKNAFANVSDFLDD